MMLRQFFYTAFGTFLMGVLFFAGQAVAQGYNSTSTSAPSSTYSPASFQAQELTPQAPGSGGASQSPSSGKTPTTQNKQPTQAKQKVYTRVPSRPRL